MTFEPEKKLEKVGDVVCVAQLAETSSICVASTSEISSWTYHTLKKQETSDILINKAFLLLPSSKEVNSAIPKSVDKKKQKLRAFHVEKPKMTKYSTEENLSLTEACCQRCLSV